MKKTWSEASAVTVRIIPRLDIKGPNLVKGIHLEGLRVLGKPEHFARCYYEQGADELLYMDVVASLYQRNNLPLSAGGALKLGGRNTILQAWPEASNSKASSTRSKLI